MSSPPFFRFREVGEDAVPCIMGRVKLTKRGYLQEVSSFISFDYSILGKIFANGFTSTLANHFGNRVR